MTDVVAANARDAIDDARPVERPTDLSASADARPAAVGAASRLVSPLVMALFAIDVLLAALNVIRWEAVGSGRSRVWWLFALGGEQNVGTWYSVLQLGLAGMLLAAFAYVMTTARRPGAWLLWLAPAAFLFLSADEGLELHEWIGGIVVKRLGLSGGGLSSTFAKTGVWWLVLAPVFIAGMGLIAWATRPFWRGRRRAIVLTALGLLTFVGAATGVEALTNAASRGRMENLAVSIEELGEMVGATLIVWGALELMASHGIRLLVRPEADPGPAR